MYHISLKCDTATKMVERIPTWHLSFLYIFFQPYSNHSDYITIYMNKKSYIDIIKLV